MEDDPENYPYHLGHMSYTYRNILKKNPEDFQSHFAVAVILKELGDVLELNPNADEKLIAKIGASDKKVLYAAAEKHALQALTLNPALKDRVERFLQSLSPS